MAIVEIPELFRCNQIVYSTNIAHKVKASPEGILNTTCSVVNILCDHCTNFSGALIPSYYIGPNKLVEAHFHRQGTRITEL